MRPAQELPVYRRPDCTSERHFRTRLASLRGEPKIWQEFQSRYSTFLPALETFLAGQPAPNDLLILLNDFLYEQDLILFLRRYQEGRAGLSLVLASGAAAQEQLLNSRWFSPSAETEVILVQRERRPTEAARLGWLTWLESAEPDFTLLLLTIMAESVLTRVDVFLAWPDSSYYADGFRSLTREISCINPEGVNLPLYLAHFGLGGRGSGALLDALCARYDEEKLAENQPIIVPILQELGLSELDLHHLDELQGLQCRKGDRFDVDYQTVREYRERQDWPVPELELYQALVKTPVGFLQQPVRRLMAAIPHPRKSYLRMRVLRACKVKAVRLNNEIRTVLEVDPELQRRMTELLPLDSNRPSKPLAQQNPFDLDDTQLIFYYERYWKRGDEDFCSLHKVDLPSFLRWRTRVWEKHPPSSWAIRKWLQSAPLLVPPARPVSKLVSK